MKTNMNKFAMIAMAAALLTGSAGSSNAQLTLDFAANPGTTISFYGASNEFNFGQSGGYQWNVTSEQGGSAAVGLLGSVFGGPFSYGPITVSGDVQYASVLGPLGQLVINDGLNGTGANNLMGTVNWIDVATFPLASGALNATLEVNVSDITYSGSNPDLQYLVANQPGSLDVSFQFATTETLTELSTGMGPYGTSYSGAVSVVPEPSSLALVAVGAFGMLLLRRRK